MGIWRRAVERYWYKPPGEYQPVGARVPPAQSGKLRALIWRDEGIQDEQTGTMVGQRDRLLRVVLLGVARHWATHWQFWLKWGLAAITAAAAVLALWFQLGTVCDCNCYCPEGDQNRQNGHSASGASFDQAEPGLDLRQPAVDCVYPLRCD